MTLIKINNANVRNTTFENKRNIRTIDCKDYQWENNDMSKAFANCYNLYSVTNINDSVTNMSRTFQRCYNIKTTPEMPLSINDMSETFEECLLLSSINEIPNNVTNMYGTFSGCTNLINGIDL